MRAVCVRHIGRFDLNRREIFRRMSLEAIVQHIEQAVAQVQNKRVAVDLLYWFHYEHFPLSHGVVNGLHGYRPRKHKLPHLGRRHHILTLTIYAALIEEKAAGRIESVHILRQMVCEQAGKEPQAAALRHFIPLRQAVILGSFPILFICRIGFIQLPMIGGQRLCVRRFQPEMLPQFIFNECTCVQRLNVIERLFHKLLGRPNILHRRFIYCRSGKGFPQLLQGKRLITKGRRGLAGAGAVLHARAGKALLRYGLTGNRFCTAGEKMLNFALCFLCLIFWIEGRQLMDRPVAALKNSEVRNHAIPIML